MSQQYSQPVTKRKRTGLKIFGGIVVLGLVGLVACVATIGKAADDVSKDLDRAEPVAVTAGKAFTIGKHETLAGWKVSETAGMFTIFGKAKNTSDATSTAFLHFKFLDAKGEVLGNVSCNSSDLEPGQTQALNCIPDGTFGKYVKITAEATF